jgi:GT2 family glycosyltransferase
MSERARGKVVVTIPTFRRPRNLARLLEALAGLRSDADISVIVADNDAERREGLEVCERLAPNYRWPLRAVLAEQRGIAQVRNRLMAEALADKDARFIAMIDDDEWPDADWIDEFLCAQEQSGADALQGAICFAAESGGSSSRPDIRAANGVTMLESAGNLLLSAKILRDMAPPWFDPAFALTGGEDRDFFLRLAGEGARFAWADRARVHGDVPEIRASLAWTLKRAYSNGNSDMRVLLKHRPGTVTRVSEAAKILGVLLLSPLLTVILWPSPNRRLGSLAKLCRAAGKLTAMLGWRYNEYAVVHGE